MLNGPRTVKALAVCWSAWFGVPLLCGRLDGVRRDPRAGLVDERQEAVVALIELRILGRLEVHLDPADRDGRVVTDRQLTLLDLEDFEPLRRVEFRHYLLGFPGYGDVQLPESRPQVGPTECRLQRLGRVDGAGIGSE